MSLFKWCRPGLVVAFAMHCAAAFGDDPGPLPARFDVVQGAPITLRAGPSEDSPFVTAFEAGRPGLEILRVSENGEWGLINHDNRTGWLPLAQLVRQQDGMAMAPPLRCQGGLPFWGLHMPTVFFARYERPEHLAVPLQVTGAAQAPDIGGIARVWTFAGSSLRATLSLRPAMCLDEITGQASGLRATLTLIDASGETQLRLGCCNLTTR